MTKTMEEQESYCDPGEKEEDPEAVNRIAELEEEIVNKTKSNELLQSEIRTLQEQQIWADTVRKQNKKKISDMITSNDEINIQIYRYLDDIELSDRKRLDYVIAFNKLKYELELAGKENIGDKVGELEESVKIAREEKSKC